jgi:hypothetical protein
VVLRILVGAVLGGAILAGHGTTTAAAAEGDVLVVVDAPAAGSRVGGNVIVRGWAADPTSASGTGVERVVVYLDGEIDGGGVLAGEARYGLARSDVARTLGAARFRETGFSVALTLPPGPHSLYVYARPSGATAERGWSEPTTLAVDVGPRTLAQAPQLPGPPVVARSDTALPPAPRVVTQSSEPALPPAHCAGVPAPFGVYGIETPQSYGAIYPFDMPFVFGNPRFWLTYGSPNAPAYVDLREGTVYTNSYFYQPRPARGIPLVC